MIEYDLAKRVIQRAIDEALVEAGIEELPSGSIRDFLDLYLGTNGLIMFYQAIDGELGYPLSKHYTLEVQDTDDLARELTEIYYDYYHTYPT